MCAEDKFRNKFSICAYVYLFHRSFKIKYREKADWKMFFFVAMYDVLRMSSSKSGTFSFTLLHERGKTNNLTAKREVEKIKGRKNAYIFGIEIEKLFRKDIR